MQENTENSRPEEGPGLNAAEELSRKNEELLYSLAELDNSYKRRIRNIEDLAGKKAESLALSAVGLLDDLERLMAALQADKSEHAAGAAYIYKKYLGELRRHGCEQIHPMNEKFNSDMHEAVSAEDSGAEPQTVVSVVQNGYVYNNKLLRAAKVRISK